MLIDQTYFKDDHIAMRDVDGSVVEITLEDAMDLFMWLQDNMHEIGKRLKIVNFNREMDQRNHIIASSVEKPWLPLHDGE